MKISEAIKTIRKNMKYSQKDFAELCEISQTYLSQIENNKKVPNLSIIEVISEKTKIPLPVIMYLALEDKDVKDEKKEMFNVFKPTINKFIQEIFMIS